MSITQVTVTGKFQSAPSAVPKSFRGLQWKLNTPLFNSGQPVADTTPIPVALDATGAFSTVLWAVDDVGTAPTGGAWTLSGFLDEIAFSETYTISRSMSPTVDISSLTPSVASNPVTPVNAVQLQSRPIISTAPTDQQVLEWVAADGMWEPKNIPSGVSAAGARVNTTETTASGTYTDLTTTGPTCIATVGAAGIALVFLSMGSSDTIAGQNPVMGVALSGANTVAAADVNAAFGLGSPALQFGFCAVITGLSAGATTFTSKYRATGGTATFNDRTIAVIAF